MYMSGRFGKFLQHFSLGKCGLGCSFKERGRLGENQPYKVFMQIQ